MQYQSVNMSKRFGRKLSEECAKVLRTIDTSNPTSEGTRSPYFPESSSECMTLDTDDRHGKKMENNEGQNIEKIKKLGNNISLRTHSLVKYENTCTAPGPSAPVSDVQAQVSGQDFTPGPRLSQDFYDQDSITLAKALLGQIVVRVVDGVRISGAVVETESYLGGPDVASHSHNGKRTARTEPMYMKPGTSYVYSIYGMYYCFNISSQGDGSCVLIRSLEPLEGFQKMETGRNQRRKNTTPLKIRDLCNGPSKICQALHLNKDSSNKVDLAESKVFWLEQSKSIPENQVIVTKRIGIDSCGEEWANKPLRFYVNGNKCVSVRDKKAENIF